MDAKEGLAFVAENHRAVMVTTGSKGKTQTSPITVGSDGERAVISSRETAYKVRNLERDPNAILCVFTDAFFGPWIQIEGRAEIVHLPGAMELLENYYRDIRGEHPNWDEYRQVMRDEKRVLIRIAIDKVGPTKQG
jgi:PPOX class probable F420-dependent enzyme